MPGFLYDAALNGGSRAYRVRSPFRPDSRRYSFRKVRIVEVAFHKHHPESKLQRVSRLE